MLNQIWKRFKVTNVKKEKLDSRYSLIKSMLYSANEFDPVNLRTRYKPWKHTDSPIAGISISPDGSSYEVVNETEFQRDMLEREWYLYQHAKTKEFLAIQKRKYDSIRKAMLELEKRDKRLFQGALMDMPFQFFPTTMRIPTETLPTTPRVDENKAT
jgi:hypothetical protein